MRIGEILRNKQPVIHKEINKHKEKNIRKIEELSFHDIENLMKHTSYKRVNGTIRQVRY